METIEGLLVDGKLGRLISTGAYRIDVAGFEIFTEDAKLYALLEWANFLRPDASKTDRLKYLYEKCWEYKDPNKHIEFRVLDNVPVGCGYAIELEEGYPF